MEIPPEILALPDDETPAFSFEVFDEPGDADVSYHVTIPAEGTSEKASLGLLFGLAIMSLIDDQTVQIRALELIKAQGGNISQAHAVQSIKLLLRESLNDEII